MSLPDYDSAKRKPSTMRKLFRILLLSITITPAFAFHEDKGLNGPIQTSGMHGDPGQTQFPQGFSDDMGFWIQGAIGSIDPNQPKNPPPPPPPE